jgi:hypothetical protein
MQILFLRYCTLSRLFSRYLFVLAPYTIISLTLADKLTKAVTGKDAL